MSEETARADPPAGPWHRPITAEAFHKAMVQAGVIRDGERIRRLVIDAQEGCCVLIHVERFGDERLLDIARSLDGVEVHCGQPASYDKGGYLPAGLTHSRNEAGGPEEVASGESR